MININIDYAADDSCQYMLWAKGGHTALEFLDACEKALLAYDGEPRDLSNAKIHQTYFRTVRASADIRAYGVCDTVRVESKQGKGAYLVTVLSEPLPMFI